MWKKACIWVLIPIAILVLYHGLWAKYAGNPFIIIMGLTLLFAPIVNICKDDVRKFGAVLSLLGVVFLIIFIIQPVSTIYGVRNEIIRYVLLLLALFALLSSVYIYYKEKVEAVVKDTYVRLFFGVFVVFISIIAKTFTDIALMEVTGMPPYLFLNAQLVVNSLVTALIIISIFYAVSISLALAIFIEFIDKKLSQKSHSQNRGDTRDLGHKEWGGVKDFLARISVVASKFWKFCCRWYRDNYPWIALFFGAVASAIGVTTIIKDKNLERLVRFTALYSSLVRNDFRKQLDSSLYCLNKDPNVFVMVSNDPQKIVFAEWPDNSELPVFYQDACERPQNIEENQ